jgi:hypothetical protein
MEADCVGGPEPDAAKGAVLGRVAGYFGERAEGTSRYFGPDHIIHASPISPCGCAIAAARPVLLLWASLAIEDWPREPQHAILPPNLAQPRETGLARRSPAGSYCSIPHPTGPPCGRTRARSRSSRDSRKRPAEEAGARRSWGWLWSAQFADACREGSSPGRSLSTPPGVRLGRRGPAVSCRCEGWPGGAETHHPWERSAGPARRMLT